MRNYIVNDDGLRRLIDIVPAAKNLRERLALLVLKAFAPRLHAVEIGQLRRGEKSPLTATQAKDAWRTRMLEWSPQRLEDVYVLEFVEDETGE